ncbi:MAG: serine/threonine-protein kinase, partial [Kofleriaceae bacterium]
LERNGRLSLADALPILRGIGRALDAAHAKGIAHRDLKAENVFLAQDEGAGVFPKLLDFGIAKLMAPEEGLKHKTRTGTPVGTPYYMSPEQCRGRDVDHRTDLYAFGVLAYLLLTGVFPHDADDYMSILMRQLTETPSAASTIAPELPHTVDDALAWLLAKDPADRPPSLRAAVAALEGGTGADTGPSQQVLDGDVPKATTGVVAAKPASNPWATPPVVAVATRSWLPMIAAGVVVAVAAAVVLVVKPWASEPAPRPIPTVPIHVPIVLEKPAPKPRPTEAQTVIISVEGVPDGTEVIVGGMTAGAAPGPVQLPRDTAQMVLTFKLDGYLPTSRTIVPDRDQSLVLALKKKPGGVARPRSTKDDIIDLFPQNKR